MKEQEKIFRVSEFSGVFKIERLKTTIKHVGFPFYTKEKIIESYHSVDCYGNFLVYTQFGSPFPPCGSFKVLKDALEVIKEMGQGRKYHYPNDNINCPDLK